MFLSADVQQVGLRVLGGLFGADWRRLRFSNNARRDLTKYVVSNFVLHGKHVGQRHGVGLAPDFVTIVVQERRGNTDIGTLNSNAALQQVHDAQLSGNRRGIIVGSGGSSRRCPSGNCQPVDTRQALAYLFGEPAAQVVLARIVAQVFERQYRDRRVVGFRKPP